MSQTPEEVTVDALPASQVDGVGKAYAVCPPAYSSKPPGRFLRGKHGITHFYLQKPEGSESSRIAVLSHGLGTDVHVYHGPITDHLLKSGFTVLRYEFYGHGWSYSKDTWQKYDKEVFKSQIEELLDFVLSPGQPVDLWVGHSTGCIVGVLNALNKAHPTRALALVSPAFWANKPVIAKIADQIPSFMFGLVKSVGPLKKLPQDAYLENNDVAFGKKDKEYLFPQKHNVARENIIEKFKTHPQLSPAILSICSWFLREDLITEMRAPFKELVEMVGPDAPKIGLFWGKYDIVVPFKHAREDVMAWGAPGRVSLVELEAGHEALFEIPEEVGQEIAKFALSATGPQSKM